MRIRSLLLLALSALAALPATALGHAGHLHPAEGGSSILERADARIRIAQLDAMLDAAPAAVRGRCARTVDVPDQGPSCRLRNGLWGVRRDDGTTISTHGPDYVASLQPSTKLDPAHQATIDAAGDVAANPDDSSYVACTTNLRASRTLAVLAVPADNSGYDPATIDADIRGALRQASRFVEFNSTAHGSTTPVRVRMQCTAGGTIEVRHLAMPFSGQASFDQIEAAVLGALPDLGLDAVRVAVYYPVNYGGKAGQGSLYDDDRQDRTSYNNTGGLMAVHYKLSSGKIWWETYLHEILHNMGAVQSGGQSSTGDGGHCSTEEDVMCYDDDGTNTTYPLTTHPAEGSCRYLTLDCRRNTYFDAAPTVNGPWLATHWNVGQPLNRFLDFGARTIDVTPPMVPVGVVASSPDIDGIAVAWSVSGDNSTGPVTYRIKLRDAATGLVRYVPATGATVIQEESAELVDVTISAIDAAGNESDFSTPVRVTMADRSPLRVPNTLRVTSVGRSTATLTWADTNAGRAGLTYEIERTNAAGSYTTVASGLTATSATVPFAAGSRAALRVVARRLPLALVRSTPITLGSAVKPGRCRWTSSDRIAPTKPAAPRISKVRGRNATVVWGRSRDLTGVCAYRMFVKSGRSWKQIGPSIAGTRTSATVKRAGARPVLRIEAFDGAGNVTARVPVALGGNARR